MFRVLLSSLLLITLVTVGCVQSSGTSGNTTPTNDQVVGAIAHCEDGVLWLRLANGKVEEFALPDDPSDLPPNVHLSTGRMCRIQVRNAVLVNEEGHRFTTPQVTKFEWL